MSDLLKGLLAAKRIAARFNLAGQDHEANQIQDAIDAAIAKERAKKRSGK